MLSGASLPPAGRMLLAACQWVAALAGGALEAEGPGALPRRCSRIAASSVSGAAWASPGMLSAYSGACAIATWAGMMGQSPCNVFKTQPIQISSDAGWEWHPVRECKKFPRYDCSLLSGREG